MKGRLLAVMAVVLAMTLALAPAVWAAEPGKRISNTLEATLTEEAKDKPTVTIHDDLSEQSIAGLWDVFSVSTTPNGYKEEMVRARITIEVESTDDFTLEYLDSNTNTFKPLSFTDGEAWYGPAGGFPLLDATSIFRVTWHEAGTYTARVSIKGGPGFGEELASTSRTVQVTAGGHAIRLNWTEGDDDGDGRIDRTYTVGRAFDVEAQANLDNGLTHVDGVLYVVEVTKDGTAATPDDLTITGTGGQALGYQDGYFYWGPSTGFTFGCVAGPTATNCAGDGASTTFTVTVQRGGDYSVQAYAVQLPAGATWPRPGN